MTAIAEPWPVPMEKIPFENLAELRYVANLNAVQTIAAADHHGVALTEDSIAKMVALRATLGPERTSRRPRRAKERSALKQVMAVDLPEARAIDLAGSGSREPT